MINIKDITYNAVLLTSNSQRYNVDDLLQSLSWEENAGEIAQRSNYIFKNKKYNGKYLTGLASPGNYLLIYSSWGYGKQEVFRGPIWDYDYQSAETKNLSLTAYDNFIYLQQSDDYKWFDSGTSSKTMLNEIFSDWGVPIYSFDGPDVVIGKKVFKGKKISDMILEILDDAKKKGAGKFIPRCVKGKAQIVKRGSNKEVFRFEGDSTNLAAEQISLGQLVTRVKVVGVEDTKERTPVEAVVNGRTEFGILQTTVQRNQDNTLASAKSSAEDILKEYSDPKHTRRLEGPDLPFLRKGDKIFVNVGSMNDYYFITSIQHNASNKMMTMEVEP